MLSHYNSETNEQIIITKAIVGDLSLILIESKQMIEAINLCILLFTSPTLSSYLLVDSLELLQLELGLSTPIIEVYYSIFGYYITKR